MGERLIVDDVEVDPGLMLVRVACCALDDVVVSPS